jgi:hypothetical protein
MLILGYYVIFLILKIIQAGNAKLEIKILAMSGCIIEGLCNLYNCMYILVFLANCFLHRADNLKVKHICYSLFLMKKALPEG